MSITMGDEAKKILESPAFKTAVDGYKQRLTLKWEKSAPDQQLIREEAYHQLAALEGITRELRVLIGAAEMEKSKHG